MFLYCSAYLLVSLTIYFMISFSKRTQNIVQCHIFYTISGSKITTEHFCLSYVIVCSLPPEISVQYLTLIWIVHNFQHFTVCQNFLCHCYAPSITPESTAEQSALTENMQANSNNCRTYVDSYTKWKAGLFSAYLQKELTHDVCVDLKPAAEMKSMQRLSRQWGKYFKLQNAV